MIAKLKLILSAFKSRSHFFETVEKKMLIKAKDENMMQAIARPLIENVLMFYGSLIPVTNRTTALALQKITPATIATSIDEVFRKRSICILQL